MEINNKTNNKIDNVARVLTNNPLILWKPYDFIDLSL